MGVGRLDLITGGNPFSRLKLSGESSYFLLTWPVLILELSLSAFPLVYTIALSFTNDSMRTKTEQFIGIHNYIIAFGSGEFRNALWRTLIFVVSAIILRIVGGIAIAQLLNFRMRGRSIPRVAVMTPWIISEVAIAAVWLWLLDHQAGVLNALLVELNIKPLPWLANIRLAMITVIMVVFWKNLGFSAMLYLGSLQKIPSDIFDSCRVDGASSWQSFTNITLPYLRPTIILNIIMVSVSALNYFSLVYALTGGGPLYATELVGLYIYRESFMYLNLGYGAALATIIFVINLILSILYYRLLKQEDYA